MLPALVPIENWSSNSSPPPNQFDFTSIESRREEKEVSKRKPPTRSSPARHRLGSDGRMAQRHWEADPSLQLVLVTKVVQSCIHAYMSTLTITWKVKGVLANDRLKRHAPRYFPITT